MVPHIAKKNITITHYKAEWDLCLGLNGRIDRVSLRNERVDMKVTGISGSHSWGTGMMNIRYSRL